jgi:hypothetical protein
VASGFACLSGRMKTIGTIEMIEMMEIVGLAAGRWGIRASSVFSAERLSPHRFAPSSISTLLPALLAHHYRLPSYLSPQIVQSADTPFLPKSRLDVDSHPFLAPSPCAFQITSIPDPRSPP